MITIVSETEITENGVTHIVTTFDNGDQIIIEK